MMAWLIVLTGTAIVVAGGYFAMQWYGQYAMRRDTREREMLAAEWKRRAAERRAKAEGHLPPAEPPATLIDDPPSPPAE